MKMMILTKTDDKRLRRRRRRRTKTKNEDCFMQTQNLQMRSGIVGGTLLPTVFNIGLHDIVFTVVMAVIGAVVSFFVSCLLRKLFSKK